MKNKFSIKFAFTLLEMLVVIGIIAILVAVGTASYSAAQKKARNVKRLQDLKEIQNALEQYYTVCGYKYPTPATGDIFTSIICTSPTVAIMPKVPVDPKTITPYPCSTCTTSGYNLCADTEGEPTPCVKNRQ